MKYIVYLNSGIAMSKGLVANDSEVVLQPVYDSYEEITEEQWHEIQIPAKLVSGEWVSASGDEIPKLEWPEASEPSVEQFTMQERLEALEAAMLEMVLGE